MLGIADDYEALAGRFQWRVPRRYNIGVDVCDRPARARPNSTALIFEDDRGRVTEYSFGLLRELSNRLLNALVGLGLARGDRIAILLSQSPETAVAHLAAYKAGLVAVPLFTLFGSDALRYRLADSAARAIVTDSEGAAIVSGIRDQLPALEAIIAVGAGEGAIDYAGLLSRARTAFRAADTAADDPAMIIYTSGTTGPPKGALHGQRVLLGHLPGVEFPHEFFPQHGDCFWSPADWAWIGGLLDVLLPAWHHGVPVVARRFRKFDPDAALDLMARHEVRNVFMPPTALKLLRQAGARNASGVHLRTMGSGGETLGAELLEWGRSTFGVTINEFYGQTECNLVLANCSALMPVRAGSTGRAVPGHVAAIVDADGHEVPDGSVGQIAIRRPDPVMFLGYWNQPSATESKFVNDWLLTGDLGHRDADGYFWFQGRSDDIITSAGYRVGPGEIENCLLAHPAVALAAAIGVPDAIRTEIVKAFVVLKPGISADPERARDLQDHVRKRLAAHVYPRLIEFVDSLPTTATGKILRGELRARERAKIERLRADSPSE